MDPYRLKMLRGLGKNRAVRKLEEQWSDDYLHILQKMYPGGKVENGDFRVSGSGERGRRVSFQIDEGRWTDFADTEESGKGVLSFVAFLDGWEGVAQLLREFSTNKDTSLDIPIYPSAPKTPDWAQIFKLADKRGLTVAKRWEYLDTDGYFLGSRIRLEDKDGNKEFRLLSYRSKTVRDDGRVRPEGWRLEGGWGETSPLYGSEMFKDQTDPRPVLVCEGEKATDAARELVGDTYRCVTWGDGGTRGVKKGDWRLIPNDVDIIFWPDKDVPGKQAADKLGGEIPRLRVVDVWNEADLNDKDDLADVDATKSPWVLRMIADAKAGATNEVSKAFRDRYIYVVETEQFLDTTTMQRLSPTALNRAMAHEVDKLADELLSDAGMMKVGTFTFWPGKELIVEEVTAAGGSIKRLNLWRPNDIVPETGEPTLFLDHMEYIIPEKPERDYVLSYMAYILQHPGEKIHHAPLIGGEQGIGKSYILNLMSSLIGQHNVSEITTETLTNGFNSWMEESQLVIVEEVMAMGRREITNRLKPLITSPTVEINNKGLRAYRTRNCVNFMFFTNHKDALSLEEGDRRFFVYWSMAEPRGEDYYNDLFADLEENAGKIYNYLLKYDLSSFKPKGRAPDTSAKKHMIRLSQPELLSEIQSRIEEEIAPFDADCVTLRDICDWARDRRIGNPREWTPEKMANTLTKAGAIFVGRSRVHGSQNRVYAVRSQELYIDADETTIQKSVRESKIGE